MRRDASSTTTLPFYTISFTGESSELYHNSNTQVDYAKQCIKKLKDAKAPASDYIVLAPQISHKTTESPSHSADGINVRVIGLTELDSINDSKHVETVFKEIFQALGEGKTFCFSTNGEGAKTTLSKDTGLGNRIISILNQSKSNSSWRSVSVQSELKKLAALCKFIEDNGGLDNVLARDGQSFNEIYSKALARRRLFTNGELAQQNLFSDINDPLIQAFLEGVKARKIKQDEINTEKLKKDINKIVSENPSETALEELKKIDSKDFTPEQNRIFQNTLKKLTEKVATGEKNLSSAVSALETIKSKIKEIEVNLKNPRNNKIDTSATTKELHLLLYNAELLLSGLEHLLDSKKINRVTETLYNNLIPVLEKLKQQTLQRITSHSDKLNMGLKTLNDRIEKLNNIETKIEPAILEEIKKEIATLEKEFQEFSFTTKYDETIVELFKNFGARVSEIEKHILVTNLFDKIEKSLSDLEGIAEPTEENLKRFEENFNGLFKEAQKLISEISGLNLIDSQAQPKLNELAERITAAIAKFITKLKSDERNKIQAALEAGERKEATKEEAQEFAKLTMLFQETLATMKKAEEHEKLNASETNNREQTTAQETQELRGLITQFEEMVRNQTVTNETQFRVLAEEMEGYEKLITSETDEFKKISAHKNKDIKEIEEAQGFKSIVSTLTQELAELPLKLAGKKTLEELTAISIELASLKTVVKNADLAKKADKALETAIKSVIKEIIYDFSNKDALLKLDGFEKAELTPKQKEIIAEEIKTLTEKKATVAQKHSELQTTLGEIEGTLSLFSDESVIQKNPDDFNKNFDALKDRAQNLIFDIAKLDRKNPHITEEEEKLKKLIAQKSWVAFDAENKINHFKKSIESTLETLKESVNKLHKIFTGEAQPITADEARITISQITEKLDAITKGLSGFEFSIKTAEISKKLKELSASLSNTRQRALDELKRFSTARSEIAKPDALVSVAKRLVVLEGFVEKENKDLEEAWTQLNFSLQDCVEKIETDFPAEEALVLLDEFSGAPFSQSLKDIVDDTHNELAEKLENAKEALDVVKAAVGEIQELIQTIVDDESSDTKIDPALLRPASEKLKNASDVINQIRLERVFSNNTPIDKQDLLIMELQGALEFANETAKEEQSKLALIKNEIPVLENTAKKFAESSAFIKTDDASNLTQIQNDTASIQTRIEELLTGLDNFKFDFDTENTVRTQLININSEILKTKESLLVEIRSNILDVVNLSSHSTEALKQLADRFTVLESLLPAAGTASAKTALQNAIKTHFTDDAEKIRSSGDPETEKDEKLKTLIKKLSDFTLLSQEQKKATQDEIQEKINQVKKSAEDQLKEKIINQPSEIFLRKSIADLETLEDWRKGLRSVVGVDNKAYIEARRIIATAELVIEKVNAENSREVLSELKNTTAYSDYSEKRKALITSGIEILTKKIKDECNRWLNGIILGKPAHLALSDLMDAEKGLRFEPLDFEKEIIKSKKIALRDGITQMRNKLQTAKAKFETDIAGALTHPQNTKLELTKIKSDAEKLLQDFAEEINLAKAVLGDNDEDVKGAEQILKNAMDEVQRHKKIIETISSILSQPTNPQQTKFEQFHAIFEALKQYLPFPKWRGGKELNPDILSSLQKETNTISSEISALLKGFYNQTTLLLQDYEELSAEYQRNTNNLSSSELKIAGEKISALRKELEFIQKTHGIIGGCYGNEIPFHSDKIDASEEKSPAEKKYAKVTNKIATALSGLGTLQKSIERRSGEFLDVKPADPDEPTIKSEAIPTDPWGFVDGYVVGGLLASLTPVKKNDTGSLSEKYTGIKTKNPPQHAMPMIQSLKPMLSLYAGLMGIQIEESCVFKNFVNGEMSEIKADIERWIADPVNEEKIKRTPGLSNKISQINSHDHNSFVSLKFNTSEIETISSILSGDEKGKLDIQFAFYPSKGQDEASELAFHLVSFEDKLQHWKTEFEDDQTNATELTLHFGLSLPGHATHLQVKLVKNNPKEKVAKVEITNFDSLKNNNDQNKNSPSQNPKYKLIEDAVKSIFSENIDTSVNTPGLVYGSTTKNENRSVEIKFEHRLTTPSQTAHTCFDILTYRILEEFNEEELKRKFARFKEWIKNKETKIEGIDLTRLQKLDQLTTHDQLLNKSYAQLLRLFTYYLEYSQQKITIEEKIQWFKKFDEKATKKCFEEILKDPKFSGFTLSDPKVSGNTCTVTLEDKREPLSGNRNSDRKITITAQYDPEKKTITRTVNSSYPLDEASCFKLIAAQSFADHQSSAKDDYKKRVELEKIDGAGRIVEIGNEFYGSSREKMLIDAFFDAGFEEVVYNGKTLSRLNHKVIASEINSAPAQLSGVFRSQKTDEPGIEDSHHSSISAK